MNFRRGPLTAVVLSSAVTFGFCGCGGAHQATPPKPQAAPRPSASASVVAAAPAPSAGTATKTLPVCGGTIDVPAELEPDGPARRQDIHLKSEAGVALSISCLPKASTWPGTLTRHAIGIIEDLNREQPVEDVSIISPEPVDGHPVMGALLRHKSPQISVIYFTERAKLIYWLEYTAPAANWNAERARAERTLGTLKLPAAYDVGPTRWWHAPVELDARTLKEARKGFRTKVKGGRPVSQAFDGLPATVPPRGVFDLVKIKGPTARLAAYITPDPGDHQKHPAVVWAHGGFGGIDKWFWEDAPRRNDQSARAFREAGIVLAAGSWRAENDNQGDYELYYGEVDDLLALRDHVARLPYVDPNRIYLAGHSSGGTLVLLAAELSDGFRAAFSIGGDPHFSDPKSYDRFGGVPFDPSNREERLLRSSAPFVQSIRRPTFYFEGYGNPRVGFAQWMEDNAGPSAPFHAFPVLQADHFTLVAPLTELIAKKILADTGPMTSISFSQAELDALPVEATDD